MVNDAVEVLYGAPEPTVRVSVNGQTVTTGQSQVSNRYFLIPDVPLQIGNNTLRITATDHFGNARSQDLQVSRISVGSSRLTLVNGNRQTAPINYELAQPLQVVALNAAGEPLAGLPISFDVLRGTGSISTSQGAPTQPNGLTPARNLTIPTDPFGRTQVWLTVGKQAGPGANVVKAAHPALGEDVTFTASTQQGSLCITLARLWQSGRDGLQGVFLQPIARLLARKTTQQTARIRLITGRRELCRGSLGTVAKVNADMGTHQIAETNAQPLELLSVVVRDDADNLLPNIAVVFTMEAGDASFVDTNGAQAVANPTNTANPSKPAQRITLYTDKNGLVALRPQVGNTEGLIRINAYAEQITKTDSTPGMQTAGSGSNTPPAGSPGSSAGTPVGNATFLIQAKAAQDGTASTRPGSMPQPAL